MEQIDSAIRAPDAWKATVLLDVTSDYKPLLVVSTLSIYFCFANYQISYQHIIPFCL